MDTPANRVSPFTPPMAQPLPARAEHDLAVLSEGSGSTEIGTMLTGLLGDEAALYAITREWRHDAEGRKFIRLHALLDEQFTEIGVRLVKLARRSHALDGWPPTGRDDRVEPRPADVKGSGLEARMVHELVALHEALLTRLRDGKAIAIARFHDRETAALLAELIAEHEKDAFMLRALFWEIQHTAA